MTTTNPDVTPRDLSSPGGGPPRPDADSAPYWAALANHQVVAQRCRVCNSQFLPPMPGCAVCGGDDSEIVEISGAGTVYSYVTVAMALTPADEHRVPYSIATVDFDGGGRAFGVIDGGATPTIGDRVGPVFVDHQSEDQRAWTELRFAIEGRSS